MKLKRIRIRDFGAIRHYESSFRPRLNVVESDNPEQLALAIKLIFNHKITPPPTWAGADTAIEADVFAEGKSYTVSAKIGENGRFTLRACNVLGEDVTVDYLYLSTHCAEHDLSDVFDKEENKILLRFLKYANEDAYFSGGELKAATGGLSDVRAFRTYLTDFIKGFKPELLRDGKQYEIVLEKNGLYAARCKIDSVITSNLSMTERTIFRYLCFLRTAEFWRGFEELRNLHGIKKPLIIQDFLENLDQSVSVEHLLRRTAKLRRQVIIMTTKRHGESYE